jgi:fucose permease
VLAICAALGVIFTVAAVNTTGTVSVAFIALLGLANSLMWPAIFPLAINGLGKFIKVGSAILIMAIAGGATLPLLYGHLADHIGNQQSYLLMAPCYAVILVFAVAGYKVKTKRKFI